MRFNDIVLLIQGGNYPDGFSRGKLIIPALKASRPRLPRRFFTYDTSIPGFFDVVPGRRLLVAFSEETVATAKYFALQATLNCTEVPLRPA